MSREAHVRFCEGLGVQLPRPTHPELPTAEGKRYLCVVLDLFSKRVIGGSMHHRQDRQTVICAVEMAIGQRQGGWSVILHSDRGRPFRSSDYQRYLTRNTLLCSMSAERTAYRRRLPLR